MDAAERESRLPYRARVYGRYVSAFKGELSPETLRAAYEQSGRVLDHLLGALVSDLNPADVLEVGCGAGSFLYWARKRGLASVEGIDLSDEQVAVARSAGLPAEVATFQQYLPGRVERYDLVVGLDVLEHLTRDEGLAFLDLGRAALRPGGCLFLTTPNGAALRPGPVWYGDLTHETIYTPQTISLALRLAGLEPERISEIGPPPTGARARVRRALWASIRLLPMVIDLIETGSRGAGIYTRNMAVLARRPVDAGA